MKSWLKCRFPGSSGDSSKTANRQEKINGLKWSQFWASAARQVKFA